MTNKKKERQTEIVMVDKPINLTAIVDVFVRQIQREGLKENDKRKIR